MKIVLRAVIALSLCLVPTACSLQNEPSTASTKYAASPCEQTKQSLVTQDGHQVAYVLSDPNLNRLQEFLHLVLEANKKEFAGQGSVVRGFGAGSSYPQIWLRDSATIIPVARYYYPREYLTSWLEEHLNYQQTDGQLYDWIASGAAVNFVGGAPLAREVYRSARRKVADKIITISADKNTTEADQESSAVDAAYQVFKITGDRDWLNKTIRGQSLIERLNLALNYLLTKRFDPRYGLITNAFTADWGDVSPVYPDQRAIYLDEKTPTVAGLYTNALFYRAAKQMEDLNSVVANKTMAELWKSKAELIKENMNKNLWQEDKGFYRIHLLLQPKALSVPPDDSDIFAMGGNALAVLNGVADDRQARRIFDVAAQRQRNFGVSTNAGVLLPPYPAGFFKHPATSEEYVYQNGGQWDWWAGRFLLAEFERGYSQRAYQQVLEIAKKAVDNDGLYEWHTITGEGKGSRNYAGSAGVLGGAIFQGLFGVYLSQDSLTLRIRLAYQSGQIHLYEPATDRYVDYQHCYDKVANLITVRYASNFPNAGRIHILIPNNQRAGELTFDGNKTDFATEVIGEDTYVILDTDWKSHQLQVRLTN